MTDKLDIKLEALANEIDDVTDPSSIDKVMILYEEVLNEAEEYIELLVKTLQYRQITWEQPWYQSYSPLTKIHPPFYERNNTESEEEKFCTDKITKEEHDQISKNWLRFVKKYEVPDNLRLFVTWKNNHKVKGCPKEKVRQFVAAYLARGLKRTLNQVFIYIQFFNLRDLEARVYNEYEQKIMEVCYMHKLEKAPAILRVVLGRHSRALYKKRMALKTGKPEKRRHKWTMKRAEKFLKCLMAYSKLSLDELKNKTFDKPLWLKLQEEMESDYACLNFFWYCNMHVQLFAQSDVKLYKVRRKIFKILRDSTYQIWKDIKWAEVLEHFPDGFTTKFLYKMSFSIVRKHPKHFKIPLPDLANFGLETIKSSRYSNKRLKRLTVNDNGDLQVIHYNPH